MGGPGRLDDSKLPELHQLVGDLDSPEVDVVVVVGIGRHIEEVVARLLHMVHQVLLPASVADGLPAGSRV